MRALDEFKDRFLDIAEDLMPDGELKGREYWHRCPFHDDKTPSFSINIEKGTYHCFGCGARGDIINLYAKLNNITDAEAIKEMKDKYLNKPYAKDAASKPKENDLYKKQKAVQQMQYIWESAESEAEIVKRYLKGRGIYGVNPLPDNLRFSKEHNAMIAKVVDKNSNLRAIHKTILQKTDDKVKRGEKLFEKNSQAKGCAVHFDEPTDVLGVAEGIETALSVKEALPDMPMWAALSASFMDSLDIPDTVKKLYIFYDKDKSGAGRKAATKLATRYVPEGVEIYLIEPPMGIPSDSKGVDFNDVLLAQGKDAIVAAYRKSAPYGKNKERKDTIATQVIKLVEDNVVEFFIDERDKSWAVTKEGYFPIRSSKFKRLVNKWYFEAFQQGMSNDTWYNALPTIESKSEFGTKTKGKIKLSTRIADKDDKIYYQLGGNKAVEVSKNGWEIIDEPVVFRSFAHQKRQINPKVSTINDIRRFLKYCNIEEDDDKNLILIWLAVSFIPNIPRAMLVSHGSQGSGKSTFFELLKDIIDPSEAGILSKPRDKSELSQQLNHHYFTVYDNLSLLPDWMSDELCRAVTGSGNSKRQLYTDDEDIFYSYKRVIGLNGINVVATNPDVLDRSILIELQRITEDKRRTERVLKTEFENDKPYILGAIFTILSRAIKIKESIENQKKKLLLPRMADFALWGYCVAEAMNIGGVRFLQAYQQNAKEKNYQVIEGNPVATAIIEFMNEKEEWKGTASELLESLNEQAVKLKLNTTTRDWPKAANALSRRLNILKVNLQEVGIEYIATQENKNRIIYLTQKSMKNTVDTVDTVGMATEQQLKHDDIGDDNDDIDKISSDSKPLLGQQSYDNDDINDKIHTLREQYSEPMNDRSSSLASDDLDDDAVRI